MARKTDEQIWNLIDKAQASKENLSGMTYQEGIEAALRWAIADAEEPLADDEDEQND